MTKRKRTTRQTIVQQTLHRKLSTARTHLQLWYSEPIIYSYMAIKLWLIALYIARKFEDTTWVIRSCKSFKGSQTIQARGKRTKRQTIVDKTLYRNPNIEQQHEPHQYQVWTHVLRKDNQFLNDNKIIGYFYFIKTERKSSKRITTVNKIIYRNPKIK